MIILVLNSGSSSLKFSLFDAYAGGGMTELASGIVDRIGPSATLTVQTTGDKLPDKPVEATDHAAAVAAALSSLHQAGVLGTPHSTFRIPHSAFRIDAVGHRVVHGGSRFRQPALIDDAVLAELGRLSDLAPLHNPPALAGIRAALEGLGGVPQVAVFDTAFHSRIPPHAATYALPQSISEQGVRRYGFHGIAHQDMLNRYCEMSGTPPESATIVTLQLGNGCSACAIREGVPVDTSMGFTPLEGLVMGTRSGDLDPGILTYLVERGNVPTHELDDLLNKRSGLLGISGTSKDMRDLLSARDAGDTRAALAIDVFCYRARKYIGAYMAALGGAQAIVFGGGIGENAPAIRAQILTGMEWAGLHVDPQLNMEMVGKEGRISADRSSVAAYVVGVAEEALIARETATLLEVR